MSTKTSPLNSAAGASAGAAVSAAATTSATAAAAAAAASSAAAASVVKIKKELPSDEIKEFAENTMNELLGWYGFDDVDRLDLSSKTSRLLQTAASASNNAINQHHMEKRRSRSRATTLLHLQQQTEHIRNIANNNNNNNNSSSHNNNHSSSNRKGAINCNNFRGSSSHLAGGGGSSGAAGGNESTTSDHDTRSSREDDSKSPHSAGKSTMDDKIDFHNCCWCRRPMPENAPEFLTTSDSPRYCSESCFTQSRRASFKKAKTCDWCKHVRHAVSYVDFQDGASQLQFCSDKCLNQYKMQIFCKETQAHLDMNPHLREQGLEALGNGAGLITPDLWLRNCRSRSASPASTISVSPGPSTAGATASALTSARITPPTTSTMAAAAATTTATTSSSVSTASAPTVAHKPMISVAPVSKLMSKSPGIMQNRQSPKHSRKKRPLRSCVSAAEINASLKSSHAGGSVGGGGGSGALQRELAAAGASSYLSKPKSLLGVNTGSNLRTSPAHMATGSAAGNSHNKSTTSALSQFAGSSVQDLHMSVPPLSPMLLDQPLGHAAPPHVLPTAQSHAPQARNATSIPTGFFATPPGSAGLPPPPRQQQQQQTSAQMPPMGGYAQRPPFLPNHMAGMLPRFLGAGGFNQHLPPPHMLQPDMAGLSALLGTPPPVTVMVPYPIIIPLPIPIPVPLPVMDFYRAYLSPAERENLKERERKNKEEQTSDLSAARNEASFAADAFYGEDSNTRKYDECQQTSEEPLDCTTSKEFEPEHNYDDVPTHIQLEDLKPEPPPTIPALLHEPEDSLSMDIEDEAPPAMPTSAHLHIETDELLMPMSPTSPKTSRRNCRATQEKATHCIVRTDIDPHDDNNEDNDDDEQHTNHIHTSDNAANHSEHAEHVAEEGKQKLPKFKITRLQTKRTLIQQQQQEKQQLQQQQQQQQQTKEYECSRPLRKRKRLIDCDFQKIALRDAAAAAAATEASADECNEVATPVAIVTETATATTATTTTNTTASGTASTTACNSQTKAFKK